MEADLTVLTRMAEFLGERAPGKTTAAYMTCEKDSRDCPSAPHQFVPRPPRDLWECSGENTQISRSLWDHEFLIADLDIEYVNFDFPAEPFLDWERSFRIQRPVTAVVEGLLGRYDIKPLHLLTGRGHHFIWKVGRRSDSFQQLVRLGHVHESLRNLYARPQAPDGKSVDPQSGAAFSGLGQVMEYLGHSILQAASGVCEVSVQLTEVQVGSGTRGREIVSIDLSEYGDPLHTRRIRVPFSLYLKPLQSRHVYGRQVVDSLPPIFVVPCARDETEALSAMRDPNKVRELAAKSRLRIPEQSRNMEPLIQEYRKSPLAEFHHWFYSEEPEGQEDWPATYDQAALDDLPPCVRQFLLRPNDLLLKPAALQMLTRTLTSLGWHPRHVSGLVRSKYEREYDWGDQWKGYDPAQRADFYVRLFAGMTATNVDGLVDFNCLSTAEKGYCPQPWCGFNLEDFKGKLVEGRTA